MGSNLRLHTGEKTNSHSSLSGRNELYQHPLDSIYRKTDNKLLSDIINELQESNTSIVFDLFNVTEATDVVTLTNFVYNTVKDVLLVFVDGVLMYEGTDLQYIKDSQNTVKFNFLLEPGTTVLTILAGTISGKSYGDSIFNNLSKFTQLTDTINSYVGNENKVLLVNNEGTGIVAGTVKASHDLNELTFVDTVTTEYSINLNIPNVIYITGIKTTNKEDKNLTFEVSIFNSDGDYIYDSGEVSGVLWDIMRIPVIVTDNTLRLVMKCSEESKFKFNIYYEL